MRSVFFVISSVFDYIFFLTLISCSKTLLMVFVIYCRITGNFSKSIELEMAS